MMESNFPEISNNTVGMSSTSEMEARDVVVRLTFSCPPQLRHLIPKKPRLYLQDLLALDWSVQVMLPRFTCPNSNMR